jgi:hypothetical protein
MVQTLEGHKRGHAMKSSDSDFSDKNVMPITLMIVALFYPVVVVVAPMAAWVLVSAVYKIVGFVLVLLRGPPIGLFRWLIAIGIVLAGFVLEVLYLVMLFTGSSPGSQIKRVAVASIPLILFCAVPGFLLFRGFIWLLGRVIPVELLYLSAEGPLSLGQAMGSAVGLLCWPLLLCVGGARGVLLAGHPTAQLGCAECSYHDSVSVLRNEPCDTQRSYAK